MKTEAALAFLALFGVAGASPNSDSAIVRAEELLKRADDGLLSAQTLRAVYTDTSTYSTPYRDLRQTGTVTLSKPGLVRVEIVRARRVTSADTWIDTGNNTLRVTDGTHQFSVFFHPYSTQVRESKPARAPAVGEAPILAGFFGGASTPWQQFEAAKEKGDLKDVQASESQVKFVAGSTERVVDFGSNGLISALTEHKAGSLESRTWHLESLEVGASLSTSAFAYSPPADALPYDRQERLDALDPGTDAPDISVSDASGKPIKLSDLRGKVVVLKFWATWCWPCNQSMPDTEALAAKYKSQGLETVAVAIKDSQKGFAAWVGKHPQYAHIRFAFEDPIKGDASKTYRVSATPTVYIIGRDGRIVTEFEGFAGPSPALEAAVKDALAH